MDISEIADHLASRGFATRNKWNGRSYIFFGIDNRLHMCTRNEVRTYNFSLADFDADDWEIINNFWHRREDDFAPFRGINATLDGKS